MTWEAKFVGRENELRLLKYGIEQANEDRGSILFLTGEAGVGKTRLAEELKVQEFGFDIEFLTGRCLYREGTDPYLPFIEMFQGYLSTHPYLATKILDSFNTQASVIFDIAPEGRGRYSQKPESDDVSKTKKTEKKDQKNEQPSEVTTKEVTSDEEIQDTQILEGKHRMFETVLKIIIDMAKTKPLVLFLDDLQWADAASLHLLHYIARNISKQPIFIIGAYRPEDMVHTRGTIQPLDELITRLGAENLFTTVELRRLNHEETKNMVADLLGIVSVPQDFADVIYNETEGNPFFVLEVMRTLIENAALSIQEGKLVMNISPKEIIIPTSIRELIKLRLQRLADKYVEVLEYASVIGIQFDLERLNNIIDLPESTLISILGKLTEPRFICDVEDCNGLNWKFTHNKTHEVIYTGINDNKKKMIHLKLAKYLEESKTDNISEVVYDLAYNFYHGRDFDSALSYSIEGGEKAIKAYANKDALDLYNISLNSLRRLDDKLARSSEYQEKKIEVLSKLGMLNKTMGEWDKALEYYEQIISICDDLNNLKKKSRTYLNIGWIYQQRSFWTEAENYFKKSLQIAELARDDNTIAEAYYGLGAVYEREGQMENAINCYSTSRKFAEQNEDLLNLAKAHNAFGRVYNQQGIYNKAVDHKKKSILLLEKLQDLPELAKAYTSIALTFYDMGDSNKNIMFNEKCITLADQIADIRIKGYGLSNAVESLIKTDQLEKALDYASNAHEIFKKLEERFMIALNYMNFGIIFREKKEFNKSKYYFKTAIEFMESLKIPFHLADCYRQFAEMYRVKGETLKASYYLQKAKETYISINATTYVKQIEAEMGRVKLKIIDSLN
jgi:predicted ATPase